MHDARLPVRMPPPASEAQSTTCYKSQIPPYPATRRGNNILQQAQPHRRIFLERVDAFRSTGRGRQPNDVLQRLTSLCASELERLNNTLGHSPERTGNLPRARKQFGIVDSYFVFYRVFVDH